MKKCEECGISYYASGRNQKFCGSYKKKLGCSFKIKVLRDKSYPVSEETKRKQKEYKSKYRKKYTEQKKAYRDSHKKEAKLSASKYLNRDFGLRKRWLGMKRRCYYVNFIHYKYYGGKGIKIEWLSYDEFKSDMYEDYLKHLKLYGVKNTTLDRINSNDNYSKKNCRWATWKIQNNNRKTKLNIVL